MSDNSSQQDPPVRVSGEQTAHDDHPAIRKVARAIIAMALRGVTPHTVMDGADSDNEQQTQVGTEQPKGRRHG